MKSQKAVSENASYKVVALLITLILWVIILGSKEASIVKLIPTNYILPREVVVTNLVPSEVAFHLTGPRLALKRFSESVDPLAIDLSSALEGSTTIRIHPDSIDVPPGIKVVSVSPTTITAKLERVVTAKVPVEINFRGALPKGYRFVKTLVEPSEVELTLPKSFLEKIKKVKTEIIDLTDIKTTTKFDVFVVDDQLEIFKKANHPKVNVTLEVRAK